MQYRASKHCQKKRIKVTVAKTTLTARCNRSNGLSRRERWHCLENTMATEFKSAQLLSNRQNSRAGYGWCCGWVQIDHASHQKCALQTQISHLWHSKPNTENFTAHCAISKKKSSFKWPTIWRSRVWMREEAVVHQMRMHCWLLIWSQMRLLRLSNQPLFHLIMECRGMREGWSGGMVSENERRGVVFIMASVTLNTILYFISTSTRCFWSPLALHTLSDCHFFYHKTIFSKQLWVLYLSLTSSIACCTEITWDIGAIDMIPSHHKICVWMHE